MPEIVCRGSGLKELVDMPHYMKNSTPKILKKPSMKRKVWINFSVPHPRRLPKSCSALVRVGSIELTKILESLG